jgi:hypothetical protein
VIPSEAARLLLHAAAFDNRKPSAGAAAAWAAALHDIPLDEDTLGAVARYYGTAATDDPNDRRWIQPHHVRFHRAKIREPRIDAAHPVYDGNPLESSNESAANLRALNTAAADGHLGTRTIRQALDTKGQQRIPLDRRLRAMLEAAGQNIPTENTEPSQQPTTGINVLGVACPICDATIGQTCHTGRGRRRADVHPGRKDDAHRASQGLPPVDRDQVRRDEEHRRQAALALLDGSGPSTFVPPTRDEAVS